MKKILTMKFLTTILFVIASMTAFSQDTIDTTIALKTNVIGIWESNTIAFAKATHYITISESEVWIDEYRYEVYWLPRYGSGYTSNLMGHRIDVIENTDCPGHDVIQVTVRNESSVIVYFNQ